MAQNLPDERGRKMTRPILTLKKKPAAVMPSATEAPKSAPAETQQKAQQQPQKKNKAEAHAKKRKRRTGRILAPFLIKITDRPTFIFTNS
ncbi:hypothetical protein [Morganella sp. GD04133]|uniref:hypothetical protein n=1 Tax=Morganella sp. GD04133 TaxID=2975435 RepID=UPI00244A8C2B|nr:hypothetical protein [Morganella sp. GD04133]MDH0353590.1 hypothetical protein [Morganella sp. GD04133]